MRLSDLTPTTPLKWAAPLGFWGPSVSAASNISIQVHPGQHLRASYGEPREAELPSSPTQLLNVGHKVVHAEPDAIDQSFADGIVTSLSSLRSFAISLTRDVAQAEDLVQETVLRAISKQDKFEPGTNLRAWLFAIMRNLFCSAYRKTRHEVEDVDGSYAATMISIPDYEDRIMLEELVAALAKLPHGQREAMMLVGAEGMTYEEAAQALGCAIGTIQSRVNRARNRLAEMMGLERTERQRRGAAKAKSVFW
jgi:RNA polymerase sigma-70 factor (ECF subfamily)